MASLLIAATSVRGKWLHAHGPELSVTPCRGVHQLDQLQAVQVVGVDVVGDGPAVGGEVNGIGGGVFQEGEV